MLPVSVIIPARNEGDNIARLIESLRTQIAPPAEIIVVDAGSTDDTAKKAAEAGAKVILVDRAYPGQARNIGIRHAQYDIIACWDASMRVAPDTLNKLVTPLLQGQADLVQGHLEIKPQSLVSSIYLLLLLPPHNYHLPDGTKMYAPPVACTAFRRNLWEAVNGFRPWRAREDSDFRKRLMTLNPRIQYIPEAVSYWEAADSWVSLLRKVRLYGRHNLLSGQPREWYASLVKVYSAYLAASLTAGILGGLGTGIGSFIAMTLGGGLLRALRKIFRHGAAFKEKTSQNPYAPRIIFLTTGLLVATDIASFLGAMDWLLLDKLKLKPERFPEPTVLGELLPPLPQ
ncbi:MAG: glycosyltransferase [Bacteroidia bacterium]